MNGVLVSKLYKAYCATCTADNKPSYKEFAETYYANRKELDDLLLGRMEVLLKNQPISHKLEKPNRPLTAFQRFKEEYKGSDALDAWNKLDSSEKQKYVDQNATEMKVFKEEEKKIRNRQKLIDYLTQKPTKPHKPSGFYCYVDAENTSKVTDKVKLAEELVNEWAEMSEDDKKPFKEEAMKKMETYSQDLKTQKKQESTKNVSLKGYYFDKRRPIVAAYKNNATPAEINAIIVIEWENLTAADRKKYEDEFKALKPKAKK